MKKIKVSLKGRPYDIFIGRSILKDTGSLIKNLNIGSNAIVITNGRLARLYGKPLSAALKKSGIAALTKLVPDSEKAKSYGTAIDLINSLSKFGKRKKIFIIALGGGVVGDLAGFVASVYKRGIPYVQIPTTLLAQVDSAIGGKVAIDLPVAKNLVGAFYQPKAVVSDISLIKSLPRRQLINGMAEAIKYGVIKDPVLFKFIENNLKKVLSMDEKALDFIISRSAAIKARVVEKDEFDKKDIRTMLNYGHTIGHAIESAAGYSSQYHHGEAIALGMIVAARISLKLGIMKERDVKRIEGVIKDIGLPTKITKVPLKSILASYLHDKKFVSGKNKLVLPEKIGKVKVVEGVSDAVIREAIKDIFIV